MFTWSQFAKYMNLNRASIPAAVYQDIRRKGLDRFRERQANSRADTVLTFDDLIKRAEFFVGVR